MNGSSGDDRSAPAWRGLTNGGHRVVASCAVPPDRRPTWSLYYPCRWARLEVLLANMAEIGLVRVHRSTYGSADTPDMALMERVLSGLRRL